MSIKNSPFFTSVILEQRGATHSPGRNSVQKLKVATDWILRIPILPEKKFHSLPFCCVPRIKKILRLFLEKLIKLKIRLNSLCTEVEYMIEKLEKSQLSKERDLRGEIKTVAAAP